MPQLLDAFLPCPFITHLLTFTSHVTSCVPTVGGGDQAATRLARQNEQEAQASFDAERARLAGELEERLRSLKETHQKETLELRKQIERSALEVKGASEAAAATVTRVEIEKDEAVFEATCTAEDAIRAVSAEADEKVSALEEEVQRLREQLGSVPKALKAELEEEFGERGRVLREEVQVEFGLIFRMYRMRFSMIGELFFNVDVGLVVLPSAMGDGVYV